MQQRDTAAASAAVRVERRGKSSPPVQETGGACKPYPMQRRARESAGPAVTSATGGTEHVRRRHAKIDCHTRQNPAYRSARYLEFPTALHTAGRFCIAGRYLLYLRRGGSQAIPNLSVRSPRDTQFIQRAFQGGAPPQATAIRRRHLQQYWKPAHCMFCITHPAG